MGIVERMVLQRNERRRGQVREERARERREPMERKRGAVESLVVANAQTRYRPGLAPIGRVRGEGIDFQSAGGGRRVDLAACTREKRDWSDRTLSSHPSEREQEERGRRRAIDQASMRASGRNPFAAHLPIVLLGAAEEEDDDDEEEERGAPRGSKKESARCAGCELSPPLAPARSGKIERG